MDIETKKKSKKETHRLQRGESLTRINLATTQDQNKARGFLNQVKLLTTTAIIPVEILVDTKNHRITQLASHRSK